MWFVLLNLVVAAVPSLFLLLYFCRRNRGRKEPPKLIWKTFGFGLAAVVPALVIELTGGLLIKNSTGILAILAEAFIITAFVEESAKFLVVRLYIWNKADFSGVTDGIVYTISASLGFALLENLLYSFGPTLLLIFRGITAVPLHALAAGIMGYYLGMTKMTGERKVFIGIFYAVLLHGLYDFLLFTETFVALFVIPLLIGAWFVLRKLYKKALLFDFRRKNGIPRKGLD
jgi:protease PrsW